MSEVRLVIREADRDWSGNVHGSLADCAIAALSADPMTLVELESACARYQKPNPDRPILANLSEGLRDEPYDAGIVVIDLMARLVMVESRYSSPEPTGDISYHNGDCATDKWLRYHLAKDWLFIKDHTAWQPIAQQRRTERAANPPRDVRAVFYGRPLLEHVARRMFAAFGRTGTDDRPTDDAIKEIHAAWMLTPRDDLGGACPRELAVAGRKHITWDLQDQSERWSIIGQPPPWLDVSSFAYRFARFGIHELVIHYELVRELLWSCRDRLADVAKEQPITADVDSQAAREIIANEVARLEQVRDGWLDAPDREYSGRSPRSVIEHERVRRPEAMTRHEGIVDSDCPCCQMMADMPGPAFWHLDGCNMDDDFAFDMWHVTLEEWEEKQRQDAEFDRRFNAQWEERKRLGMTGQEGIWQASYAADDGAGVPLGVRVFTVGARLAELIADIRFDAESSSTGPDVQPLIDQLNRHFGNLREVVQNSEPGAAEALARPVIDRFSETLAGIATTRPTLAEKCYSLTQTLGRFVEPDTADPY